MPYRRLTDPHRRLQAAVFLSIVISTILIGSGVLLLHKIRVSRPPSTVAAVTPSVPQAGTAIVPRPISR